ncbi:hypothetical protein JHL22_01715 [Advenella sp. WQ 585]|uniref:Permease n=1 Tax=Advenella mandrilli TaxID=2800330 RepID=A0ABS1E8H2_9BURK|nr:hypothetical protein [Advenella mandrilli]MBK1779927.1 hypothetical protein [Advenella mandrilli]
MQRALTFDSMPGLMAPMRFFLAAPLFAMLAALLLLLSGSDAWLSRWSPVMLSVTHLFTLGILTMSMTGSLIQLLPVAFRIQIPFPNPLGLIVFLLLGIGTLTLASAFLALSNPLFITAAILLGSGLAICIFALNLGFWRSRRQQAEKARASILAVRYSVASLAITVILGLILVYAFTHPLGLSLVALTNLHALWGLAGWVAMLLMGISFQVIPLFQVTEIYPASMTRRLLPALFIVLLLWTVFSEWFGLHSGIFQTALVFVLVILALVFTIQTGILLKGRKRPEPDVTTLFWRLSLGSLFGSGILLALLQLFSLPQLELSLGILFILGCAYSAINGMLYKIVPFLVLVHSQEIVPFRSGAVPKIKDILPEAKAMRQFWVQLLTVPAMLAAAWQVPGFATLAALLLLVSAGMLFFNLLGAVNIYHRLARQYKKTA